MLCAQGRRARIVVPHTTVKLLKSNILGHPHHRIGTKDQRNFLSPTVRVCGQHPPPTMITHRRRWMETVNRSSRGHNPSARATTKSRRVLIAPRITAAAVGKTPHSQGQPQPSPKAHRGCLGRCAPPQDQRRLFRCQNLARKRQRSIGGNRQSKNIGRDRACFNRNNDVFDVLARHPAPRHYPLNAHHLIQKVDAPAGIFRNTDSAPVPRQLGIILQQLTAPQIAAKRPAARHFHSKCRSYANRFAISLQRRCGIGHTF